MFEYTDHDADSLVLRPLPAGGPGPAVSLIVAPREGESAGVFIPLDRVEEVIAGLRDMARQAGGQTAPLRRRLTELEHDRAWHAIEGHDWESADPDTVLNAVLGALDIDAPASPAAPTSAEEDPEAACLRAMADADIASHPTRL